MPYHLPQQIYKSLDAVHYIATLGTACTSLDGLIWQLAVRMFDAALPIWPALYHDSYEGSETSCKAPVCEICNERMHKFQVIASFTEG